MGCNDTVYEGFSIRPTQGFNKHIMTSLWCAVARMCTELKGSGCDSAYAHTAYGILAQDTHAH